MKNRRKHTLRKKIKSIMKKNDLNRDAAILLHFERRPLRFTAKMKAL